MNVKLEHSNSISTTYLEDKGSIMLRHINNNPAEYTISTQKTKSKTFTDMLWEGGFQGIAHYVQGSKLNLVKTKGTLDGKKGFIIYEEK